MAAVCRGSRRSASAGETSRISLSVTERLAVGAGLAAGELSRRLGCGDGAQIPGRVMLGMKPRLAERLAAGRVVTLVSATNGKSTTTAMLTAALRASGVDVTTNERGANMMPGLTSALAQGRDATHAVLETDEAVLPEAVRALNPTLVVLGELSRDQLDRHHEVSRVAENWRAAFDRCDARFIAPANDPNVAWSVDGRDVDWVRIDSYSHLDANVCPRCNAIGRREQAESWSCQCADPAPRGRVTQHGDVLTIDGRPSSSPLALRGRWQHANRALAVAAALALDVEGDVAITATSALASVGARADSVPTPWGHDARLVLAKNPAGWAAVIDDVRDRASPIVIIQNDDAPDGRDPSWLWDVPFEDLAPRRIVASGTRSLDVAVRAEAAGLEVVAVEPDPQRAVARVARSEDVLVVASYSAHAQLSRRARR